MGLFMGQELHGFDYNDTSAVGKQFRAIRKEIDTYKNHPNILCWVAGNELNLSAGKGVPVNRSKLALPPACALSGARIRGRSAAISAVFIVSPLTNCSFAGMCSMILAMIHPGLRRAPRFWVVSCDKSIDGFESLEIMIS